MSHLLLISNGHGEDTIACTIAPLLQARGFRLSALPIVGEGQAYGELGIPVISPARALPSGGFIYGRPFALVRDLFAGLPALTFAQIRALRSHASGLDGALAVGDVVPLLFARLLEKPYAFVGCAKSDYYLGGKPGSYLWHEKALLRHPLCKGCYPRDAITTENLRSAGVEASYLGNPMMDGLAPTGYALPGEAGATALLLLPGSRQEAPANFERLREGARAIRAARGNRALRVWAAIAPQLSHASFAAGEWRLEGSTLIHPDGTLIHLLEGAFADALNGADLVLAMAGTATEQAVGLGKPVITMAGKGPQFTYAFAEAQARLLGESIALMSAEPSDIAQEAWAILEDSRRREAIAKNGRRRMGESGASERIASAVAGIFNMDSV